MPYINKKQRQALVEGECIETTRPQNVGELNYCITYLVFHKNALPNSLQALIQASKHIF